MNKIKLIAFLLIPAQGFGQQISLEECISTAKKQNASVKIAQIDNQTVQKKIAEVKSGLLPQVNVSGDYKYITQIPEQVVPASLRGGPPDEFVRLQFGVPWSLGTSIAASQILFSPQLNNALEIVKISNEAASLSVQKAEKEVAYQVSSIYYNVQLMEKQIAFLKSNVKSLEKTASTLQQLVDNQLGKKIDVDKVNLNKQNLLSNIENLESNKQQLLNSLKMLMGKSLDDEISLFPAELGTVLSATESPSIDRTELMLLEVQTRINQVEQKSIKDEFKPSVFANAVYQNTGNGQGGDNAFMFWIPQSFVGVQFKWNVFDGFLRKNKVETKKVEALKIETQRQQLNQVINLELKNAQSNLLIQNRNISNNQKQIDMAQRILDQTQNLLKEGLCSITDIIQAENALTDAQNNYLNGLIKIKMSELEIKKVTGNF
jgi:outer membrane protein TolC